MVSTSGFDAKEMVTEEFNAKDFSVIKKDKDDLEEGKDLGSGYKTRAAAAKRLRQVEFFKREKG
jgi:hypothetical protein